MVGFSKGKSGYVIWIQRANVIPLDFQCNTLYPDTLTTHCYNTFDYTVEGFSKLVAVDLRAYLSAEHTPS